MTKKANISNRQKSNSKRAAISPAGVAIDYLLELLQAEPPTSMMDIMDDFNGTPCKAAYLAAEKVKAAEILLKYACIKPTEMPSD